MINEQIVQVLELLMLNLTDDFNRDFDKLSEFVELSRDKGEL